MAAYRFYIIHRFIGIGMVDRKFLFRFILCFMEGYFYFLFIRNFYPGHVFGNVKNRTGIHFQVFCRYHFIHIQKLFYLFVKWILLRFLFFFRRICR